MKRMTAADQPRQRYQALRERARRRGLRMTPQREALLQVLTTMRHHPTADELSRAVRRRLPSVSPATVYRNVQQLAAAEVISRLERASDVIRYDANPVAHHHFICTACGHVEDVRLEAVTYRVDWRRTGLAPSGITSCEVQLRGLCAQCRS